jgi:hypothetical protein
MRKFIVFIDKEKSIPVIGENIGCDGQLLVVSCIRNGNIDDTAIFKEWVFFVEVPMDQPQQAKNETQPS